MDPRTAIHAPKGMKEAVDLPGSFAIFSLVCAGFTASPVVIPAHAHLQDPAHGTHRIEFRVLLNKGVAQSWLREKMASAFLLYRAPDVRAHFSGVSGAVPPPMLVGCRCLETPVFLL